VIQMISKVLIANRGEIALRVIKTCKAHGIKTVAVYSDEDRNSLHVKNATEAYHIGEAAPAKSYLNQEKILDVILSSGSDAVHPGYGFLSENSEFAGLCEKNKVSFIGPTAASMELCGDKMRCKATMLKAHVPTVPGSPDLVKDADEAEKIANEIGYPVMLKSVYGGGGRGIRIVNADQELQDAYETVTGESIAAVGKSAILVEKFLEQTRHIEYQFARDKHGNTVHIFERECSIQRRNQKLIEQTPSPIVDQETRDRIGKLEPIPFKQSDLKMNGYAIECRINAEDTFLDFAPSTGPIPAVTIPSGPGVRCDSYLYPGWQSLSRGDKHLMSQD